MFTDEDLELLGQADPAREVTLSRVEAHTLLAATLDALEAQPVSPTARWRKRAVRIGIGAASLGIAVPVLAYGGNFLAQTGAFAPAEGETGPVSSEWINLLAPDYPDYAVTQWPDHIVLPDSYDERTFALLVARYTQEVEWRNLEKSNAQDVKEGRPTAEPEVYEPEIGTRGRFETQARCVWSAEWLAAYDSGDQAARDEAADVLADSATWAYTVMTDGGGVVDSYKELAAAAAAGDRAAVAAEVGECPSMDEWQDARR